MAAVIIRRRHQQEIQHASTKESGTEVFIESLPPVNAREMDVVMGCLLLG